MADEVQQNWSHNDNMAPSNSERPAGNPKEIMESCLKKFKTPDYIMEPCIFGQLKDYFHSGGLPEGFIELVSANYQAVAQMANLMAEWLILAGASIQDVQTMVEDHLKQMIIKTFDPKKADSIFTEEGEAPAWLTEMVGHQTWRSLIYKLAEEYPDCLMLNFTIKLISDAGFQAEITSISTAAQQIEVFSRILKTTLSNYLQAQGEARQKRLAEFTNMACHGQHTYIYTQMLLHTLSLEGKEAPLMLRLQQEVAQHAIDSGFDVTPLIMAMNGSSSYRRTAQALSAMLSKQALNPADITVLYKLYNGADPPPVNLIRIPQFLDLLVDSLFKPGVRINPEHKPKYIYLLAYAASVLEETPKKGMKRNPNKDELKATTQAVEKVHSVCMKNEATSELIAEISVIYQCIRFPVVSVGVVRWVECTVTEPSFFKLSIEHTPVPLALLDEVATCHPYLHQRVLNLLDRLFVMPHEELEILVQLQIRKMLLDRMVHLLSRGCVVPVLRYIRSCWKRQDTDISLIRYFVTEVLEVIAPPYTSEFVQLFLPMVENEEITGSMKGDSDSDLVSEFIVYCKQNYIVIP